MQNGDVARMFDEYADILEIQGANPFRVRAYRNAARTLGDLPESVADIVGDPDRASRRPAGHRQRSGREDQGHRRHGQLAAARRGPSRGSCRRRRDVADSAGSARKKWPSCSKNCRSRSLDDLRQAAQARADREAQGIRREDRTERFWKGSQQRRAPASESCWPRSNRKPMPIVADLLKLPSVTQATLARKLPTPEGDSRRSRRAGDGRRLGRADGPRGRAIRSSRKFSPAAKRSSACGCGPASRWMCESFPTNRTGRQCSISPARRSTTS